MRLGFMKIAQVPPLYEAVPPRFYGGTERVVSHLTEALVDQGHEVTLFASAEAQTRARLVVVRDQAIRLDPAALKSDLAAHLAMLLEVRDRADQFDIIHFHTDMLQFGLFADIAEKTLTTLHGRLDMKDLPNLYRRYPEFGLVSISDSQRKPLPDANWVGTVLHGVHTDRYRPRPDNAEGYLAFLGRISPEKGPDRAIAIARAAGRRLKIAAKIDQADQAYFHEVVEPLLADPMVEFIGEIGDRDKGRFLGGADALIFPIDWPEPFGLVMIEAMAAGAPVIAYDRGSVREVIEDGLTGFIVNSEQEAADAVSRLGNLSRRAIRDRFDLRFSATAMARRYQSLYAERVEMRGPDLGLVRSA
jgi:glycosyltransferase involved in cell wall biosynthesis